MSHLLLLLPSATYRARDFLDAASRLDADVVVASDHRQALADALGDRALRVDLRDPEAAAQAIFELAQRTPLDAVVAVRPTREQAASGVMMLPIPRSPGPTRRRSPPAGPCVYADGKGDVIMCASGPSTANATQTENAPKAPHADPKTGDPVTIPPEEETP